MITPSLPDYRELSSIISADNRHQLFVSTASGDCWLETDGILVKEDNVDSSTDPLIQELAYEFEHADSDSDMYSEHNEEE